MYLIMIKYSILELDYENKIITYFFDNDSNKKVNVNMLEGFKEYVVSTNLDYYIDMNTNELVRIPGGSTQASMRGPTKGWINNSEGYFRPALQSEVDYDDLIKFNGNNGKLYKHLENIYNNL
jgi:hypothetical protein